MNKAITQGLVLMPPSFSAGLNLWSSTNGEPGDPNYSGQANAALVAADQDFGSCLELQKTTSVQKLRCFQQIPYLPGMYLRVSLRVKAISGSLPAVRIAGWAGNAAGNNVTTADQQGDLVQLTGYGVPVTISAIIGSGNRPGVDMTWGASPVYGHYGIDLTGPTGGVVRIDDITIEDVTNVFHDDMFNWVDVRDYGAIGNGIVDDTAAFEAADDAAGGKTVVVSPGTYYIANHLTLDNPAKFEGTITMPADKRLACTRNFDLDTYSAAFGGELLGFKKALQALFYFTDHNELDLRGRRIELDGPIDVAALTGVTDFNSRRVLANGNLVAIQSAAWNATTASATATYAPSAPYTLTGVTNIAAIPVGALVSGTGVGREVYVRAKNIATNTITLSQALWAATGTRPYTFKRYKYMLDFSGFNKLSRFEMQNIDFACGSVASAISLADSGASFIINDCAFTNGYERTITSTGEGCQDLHINRCQFYSHDQDLLAQNRTSIAFNTNSNDIKIRNNRASRFGHFGVVAGSGAIFAGNHFFGGDNSTNGTRKAGIVLTLPNCKTFFTGNYIDNSFIEMSNEHDQAPDFSNEYTFGGVTMTGNIFTAQNCAPWFSWFVVTPRGSGHSIQGLTISNNVFYARAGNLDRVESVDTSYATLSFTSFRNINFNQNVFNGVNTRTLSPLLIEHNQNTEAATWTVQSNGQLPFGGRARNVTSIIAEGPITDSGNSKIYAMPYATVEQGTNAQDIKLSWPSAVKGKMQVTMRVDNPA